MPKAVKKVAKKAVKKPAPKAKPRKKAPAYECGVCGYRVVADPLTGLAEEHILICCSEPMKQK